MLGPKHILSLALPLLSLGTANALDLDVSKPDSIRATAKTLAGGLAATYSKFQGNGGQAPGLFNDEDDSGNYWYQFGQAWSALIAYANLAGDSQYNDIITKALVHQVGDYQAYMPPNQTKTLGNEDQAAWGLAALTAAETGLKDPENLKWLDLAKNVFDTQTYRWDDKTCGGGHKWQIFTFNAGYNYKNTLTNGAFFLLASRLAVVTGNKTYTEWAEKSYNWAKTVKLVTDNFTVYDGTDDTTNCSQINRLQWSAAHGLYLEGSAALFNATKGEQKWRDTVNGFVKSSSVFRSNDTNVLVEVACERRGNCDTGMRSLKGQFARNLARAASYAPFIANDVRPTLEASAKAAAATCSGEGDKLKCSFQWATPAEGKTVSVDGLSEGYSALEAVQSLLYAQGKIASNSTLNPSPSQSGSPTGSNTAPPQQSTNAASGVAIAWGGVSIAGMVAVFGLL